MYLEDLVPPLKLCLQLSENAFADSFFVWYYPDNEGTHWELIPREEAGHEPKVPAPTLPEIMLALDEAGYCCPTCSRHADIWTVECEDDPVDEEASQ